MTQPTADLFQPRETTKPPPRVLFFVQGKPQTAGSKRSFVPVNKKTGQPFRSKTTGRIIVNTVDDNPKGKDWKMDIRHTGASHFPEGPFLGPVRLALTFSLARPKGHYGSGKNAETVKPSAPSAPTGKPDVLKLARAVEDALIGVAFVDDCQIVTELIQKRYTDQPWKEGVDITIEKIS